MQTFIAELIKVPHMDATYVVIPFDVEQIYGNKGQIKVKVTFDGVPYRGSLARMEKNAPHILIVTQAIRKLLGKTAGDTVKVVFELDMDERVVILPEELATLLKKNKKEYVQWIVSAKKPETKEERLHKTLEKLIAGIKNPSQKI